MSLGPILLSKDEKGQVFEITAHCSTCYVSGPHCHVTNYRDLSLALRYGCLENELLDFLLDHNITGELFNPPIVSMWCFILTKDLCNLQGHKYPTQ
jgi:hypothetical protein